MLRRLEKLHAIPDRVIDPVRRFTAGKERAKRVPQRSATGAAGALAPALEGSLSGVAAIRQAANTEFSPHVAGVATIGAVASLRAELMAALGVASASGAAGSLISGGANPGCVSATGIAESFGIVSEIAFPPVVAIGAAGAISEGQAALVAARAVIAPLWSIIAGVEVGRRAYQQFLASVLRVLERAQVGFISPQKTVQRG